MLKHDKTAWLDHISANDILSDSLRCHDATVLIFRGEHKRQGESHVLIVVVSKHYEVCIRGNNILLQLALQAKWHHRVLEVWVDVNYEVIICSRLNSHTKGWVSHPLNLITRRYVVATLSPSLLLFFDLEPRRSAWAYKHSTLFSEFLFYFNCSVTSRSIVEDREFYFEQF